MVSGSTLRLPSTTIEDVVCAAADDDISAADTVAATGMATMIRAATKPPRNTRIPTFMRDAPSSFQCQSAPPRTDRIPFVVTLVANFVRLANGLLQCNFNFNPRRCLSATLAEKAFQPGHLMDVVVERENHQHQDQSEAHAEPIFLGPVR